MEREGVKLDKERLQMMKKVRKLNENEKMKRFLEQNLVKTNKPECAITSGMMKSNLNNWNERSLQDNGNVIKECHLGISESLLQTDLALEGGRGSKRILNEKTDSPSKKSKFENLLSFWGGPQKVVLKKKKQSYSPGVLLTTCLKNFVNIEMTGSLEIINKDVDPTHGELE